jgi:two-component system chemotaxis response regulator CheV
MKLDAQSYLQTGSNELRVLEYRVAGMSFGINILKVSKIVNDLTNFTRLPESHPAIAGIFSDMGRVVPVIDLATFLGIAAEDTKREKLVVTEFFGTVSGFWVERVDWIHHFKWEDVIDAESVFRGIGHKYTIGIVKPTEDRMVQLLDYETILLDLCPYLHKGNITTNDNTIDFRGKRVLVAEDSPAVRTMLVTELTDRGFEVISATDGEQAWLQFEKQPFDLVISDVEMPQMDGLALTLRVRQSDRPSTPVIVYSSIGDVGMKARANYLKADAHITKLNLDLLLETADKLMRGERLAPQNETEETADAAEVERVPVG